MNTISRGVLDSLSASLLGYLFEFLPQTDPLSEWVPGKLLTNEFVVRLRESEFTGFAHAKKGHEIRGILIFFKGRLLEAWTYAPLGCEVGIDAYLHLLEKIAEGGVALYKLPTDAIPAVLSFTLGTVRVAGADARIVSSQNLIRNLEEERFSGTLILENGKIGQAWLYQRGQNLFPPPLPDEFREGKLHLVHAPARAPKDLFEALAEQSRATAQAELDRVWAAALLVLTNQLGRGAPQALETQRNRITSTNATEVFSLLRRFLESNFEPDAVLDFEKHLAR
ncbi:MAG: hypothetical protein RLZZ156_2333 [Deinococcota bacterium]